MSFIEEIKKMFNIAENVPSFRAILFGNEALYLESVESIKSFTPNKVEVITKRGVCCNLWGKSLHKKVLWKRPCCVWQDKIYNKLKNFYALIHIDGKCSESIINALKFRKIEIFGAKKDETGLTLTIKYGEIKKVFAISKELCYNNMTIVGYVGKSYPLYLIIKNTFLILGLILVGIIWAISNNYIFSFNFIGSGSIYQNQIKSYLAQNGIEKYSKFSDINLKALSSDILSHFDNITFVECYKSGNILTIQLIKSNNQVNVLTGDKTKLVSTCDGVIESIKVYSGTAQKKVGEHVKSGDVLVDGYSQIKDNVVSVNVIATAVIKVYESCSFVLENDNEQDLAIVFALSCYSQIIDESYIISVDKTNKIENKKEKYIYTVNYFYKCVLFTG